MKKRISPTKDYTHPFSKALARVIRRRRLAEGTPRAGAARDAKLAASAMAKLEGGEGWYSVCAAARYCDALGFDLLEVFTEALEPFQPGLFDDLIDG